MTKVLVVGDHSQLEPRLMAHFSADPRMLAVYLPGGHGDIYRDIGAGVFGVMPDDITKEQRDIAKTLVLAMGYGAGDKKVGTILTVNGTPTDMETGAAYVSTLRETYPVFFAWREEIIARVRRTGYVETIGGYRRHLKAQFVDRRNWKLIAYGERQAVNAIIQGSAGDIVRRNMVSTSRDMRLSALQLLVQVHDELVWEAERNDVTDDLLTLLKWHAEKNHGYDLRVPLSFTPQVGASWHEGKEGEALVLELPEEWADEDAAKDFEEELS